MTSSFLRPLTVASVLALTAAFAACGSDGAGDGTASQFPGADNGGTSGGAGDDGGSLTLGGNPTADDIASVAFDPPATTLTLDGTLAKSASFTLKVTHKDGSVASVQADSLQFDRPDLAKLTPGSPVTLTAPGQAAGVGTLHGLYKGKEAKAQLTVVVNLVELGPGVDPAMVGKLNAAGLGQDPAIASLLYPYDKTVFPLGLSTPLLMWTAPNANDAYRVHVEEKNYTYDGYFIVPQPAQQAIPQDTWDRVTASNEGDPLTLTVSRLDVASGTAYASAAQSWTIAGASLRGAIYYWTTSAGGHMSRIRPGQGAAPEVLNGGKCMGCHAVSADGTTLVAAVEGQATSDGSNDNRAWVSFGLPDATQSTASTYFAGNVAVNPNGKYTVFGSQKLELGATATGAVIPSGLENLPLDQGMLGFMTPAFSPDGKKLAMIEGGQGTGTSSAWYHNLMNGKLVVVDFDESTQQFSNMKSLAPASFFPAGEKAMAYPSFAPDSTAIAFHVGDYTTGCDNNGCDENTKQIGAIWLQTLAGTNPVRLATLTDTSASAADHDLSFEPTFNPVERGGYFWVVFTSSRDWGNRLTGTANAGKKRLWVAAIDKATGTLDPSHPPFFLEGQEENTANMRGFWALAQCTATPAAGAGGGACKAGFECCSGFCDQGACVDQGTLACQGVTGACTTDDECCNSSVVKCTQGQCTANTPK